MTLNQEYKSYQTVAQRDASRLQLIRRPATHGAAPPLSTHHPLPCPRLTPTHRSKNPFLIHMFTLRPKEQLMHPNSLSSPQSRHTLPCLPPVQYTHSSARRRGPAITSAASPQHTATPNNALSSSAQVCTLKGQDLTTRTLQTNPNIF